MPDSFAVSLQYLLPKQALTVLAGKIASARAGWFTTALVRAFVSHYDVDMTEAEQADPAAYPSFNAFFTRALQPGARPISAAEWVCPVDGAISQFGAIEQDQIFQAKGHHYSTTALLGGDAALAARFNNGQFATIYLSPRDYHRIHMPCAGRLTRMVHVAGRPVFGQPEPPRGVCRACLRATNAWSARLRGRKARLSWCWWAPPLWAAWPRCGTVSSTRRAPGCCGIGTTRKAKSC
jgi:phosphatidylserine decarboxylase